MIVQAKIDIKKHPIFVNAQKFDVFKNSVVVINYNSIEYIGTIVNVDIDEKFRDNIEGQVVRVATKKDIKNNLFNINDAKKAFFKCNSIIKKYNLDMKLLNSYFSLDKKQLMFIYTASSRVDFRSLAKDLANIYKTRIELRQVGIRDKASIVSGLGMCGRELCCARFLKSIDTVSINMAKNQQLALNPSKINGCCGRLLCCLNYEDEVYTECRKKLPNIGNTVEIEDKTGKVVSVDILKQSYKVDLGNNKIVDVSKSGE